MLELFWIIVLIVLGVFLLVKGADILVNGATDLARFFRVSPLLVGLTIVALGTTLPEFFISMVAAFQGSYEISIGNIIGSNISNIGLVIGISAFLAPLAVKVRTLSHEFPFMVISSFLLMILANDMFIFQKDTLTINWFDALIFLIGLGVFLLYIYTSVKKQRKDIGKEFKEEFKHKNPIWKNALLILGGLVMLTFGGRVVVNSGVELADYFSIGAGFIGLTVVAVGTSLPELFTSVVAAVKKQPGIALGNIVGSNILNILFVLGATGMVKTVLVDAKLIYVDAVIMIFFTLVFLLFATRGNIIKRHEGAILFVLYLCYIVFLARTL